MGSKWTIANSDMRGLKRKACLPQYGSASSDLPQSNFVGSWSFSDDMPHSCVEDFRMGPRRPAQLIIVPRKLPLSVR